MLIFLQVSTDGVLYLFANSSDTSPASIYAFSADVDTTGIGEVFYRETTEQNVLETISDLVNFAFPDISASPVDISYAFVATWFYVGYDNNNADLVSQWPWSETA